MKLRASITFLACVFLVSPVLATPPAQSGVVMRGDTTIAFYYVDAKRGYVVVYGYDPYAFCQGDPDFEISLWDYQVNDPKPDGVFHQLLKGDVVTSVWGLEAIDDPCAYIPIAMGSSSVVSNLTSGDVVNLSAHGVLTDPLDGEAMVFTSNLHCIVNEFGTCIDDYHAKIVLH